MKKQGILMACCWLLLWGGSWQTGSAQLKVTEGLEPFDAVQLFTGRGIKTRGERYAGSGEAIARMENEGEVPAFEEALIMSTGKASGFIGPNNRSKTSSSLMTPGDRDLNLLAGSRTFDAAVLDFDFMTDRDSFAFNFYFASEEYSEFVGSSYQDILVILLKGPGLGSGKHLAVIPGTKELVNVNTVSVHENRRYYIDNNPYNLNDQINEKQKAKLNPDLMANCQYDGMTRVFSVGSRVKPRTKYHLQILIADAGDGDNDSAVLLEAGSMQSYEQCWRIVRRRQIAEQRRADSLAQVQAIADSIAAAEAYQDSVNAAMNSTLIGEGVPDRDQEEPIEEEPVEEINVEVVEMEEVTVEKGQYQSDLADYLLEEPAEIQLVAEFEGDEFLLSDEQKAQLSDLSTYLQLHPKKKVGLYLPDDSQRQDIRYKLISVEFVLAGINKDRVFKNGFSFFSSDELAEAPLERVEIWIR